MSFWCHHLDQNINEIFSRISALASKKRSNQKIRAFYTTNWSLKDFILTLLHYFFDMTFFYRLGQKYKNIFGRFLVHSPFESICPLKGSYKYVRRTTCEVSKFHSTTQIRWKNNFLKDSIDFQTFTSSCVK